MAKPKTGKKKKELIIDGRSLEGQRRQKRTREKILSDSLACFVKYGYQNTTIDKIVALSGVSRASLYTHFKSKSHIMRALLVDFLDLLDNAIVQIRYGDDRSEIDQILDNINRVIDVFEQNTLLGKLVFMGSTDSDQRLNEVLERFFQRVEKMITHALRLGIEQGLIRQVSLEASSKIILSSFKDVILLPLTQGKISVKKARNLSKHLVDYHMHGLVIR